jgi:serine phosphatase RsbU (regulator of sigma subunit)
MSEDPEENERELRQLRREVVDQEREIRESDGRERRRDELITRLREEAAVREDDVAVLGERLETAEHELEDLRAIRDALTPSELPQRPGLDLATAFLPAEVVSGDFYLAAEGPRDSTVLVVGDVVGHGVNAARRAAFVRTAFAATAPFSDDPCQLLSWANTAMIDSAGITSDFATAACLTYLPDAQLLRCAYAGHPPALWLDDGRELLAPTQGTPLGIRAEPEATEYSLRLMAGTGVLLYTDGLTEARGEDRRLGLNGVSAALGGLDLPSPAEAVAFLRAHVADFASNLTDDLCLVAARTN